LLRGDGGGVFVIGLPLALEIAPLFGGGRLETHLLDRRVLEGLDRASHFADLVPAVGRRDRDRVVAAGQPVHRLDHGPHGLGDRAGQGPTREHGNHHGHGGADEQSDPGGADRMRPRQAALVEKELFVVAETLHGGLVGVHPALVCAAIHNSKRLSECRGRSRQSELGSPASLI